MLVPEPDPISWPIKVINSFRSPLFLVQQEIPLQAGHHAAYGVSCIPAAILLCDLVFITFSRVHPLIRGSACGTASNRQTGISVSSNRSQQYLPSLLIPFLLKPDTEVPFYKGPSNIPSLFFIIHNLLILSKQNLQIYSELQRQGAYKVDYQMKLNHCRAEKTGRMRRG